MSSKGFTLIELLVVISIIAILSVIGLVAYSNFLKSSRNAQRQSDLRIIQSALEDYHSDQISYPIVGAVNSGGSLSYSSRIYLNSIPKDPLTGNPSYLYKSYISDGTTECSTAGTCTKYCIYAKLENTTTNNLSGCPNQNNYNYALTSP